MNAVTGTAKHKARLARMRTEISGTSIKHLIQAGEIVREDIKASIVDGSVSGSGHVPSRPGEPPNADTHQLDTGIIVRVNPSLRSVTVASTALYSAALEFGHGSLIERPFMRPGLRRNKSRVVMGQVQAVRDVVRVFKG